MLAIPLNNNPRDMKIIIITTANPGFTSKMTAKATAMAPNTILETREPLLKPPDAIPEPISPNP